MVPKALIPHAIRPKDAERLGCGNQTPSRGIESSIRIYNMFIGAQLICYGVRAFINTLNIISNLKLSNNSTIWSKNSVFQSWE